MTSEKKGPAKRRTRGNPFGQTDSRKYNTVETLRLDTESEEFKMLTAAVQAGLNKADLIRRCLKHLPSVISEVQDEIAKLSRLS